MSIASAFTIGVFIILFVIVISWFVGNIVKHELEKSNKIYQDELHDEMMKRRVKNHSSKD